MTGDPTEDAASALLLASRMNGKPITDADIAELLKHHGAVATPTAVAAVRKRLPA